MKVSAGVRHPSVLRGRLFNRFSIAGRSSGGVDGQVGALGQVLAQQPVGVLIRAALPRAAGVREVHPVAQQRSELVVVGQLRTLVPRSG
jgi:hypothetical protein